MNEKSALKKIMLKLLAGSVVLGAVLGIVIVLRGEWSWFEIRVLLSTATLAAASLCALACDLSRTPKGRNLLPTAGMVLTGIATSLLMIIIWPEFDDEWFCKLTAIVSIFAVATVQACLFSIARLAKRFSWVYLVAVQVVYGLAILLSVMILGEFEGERWIRFLAALSIVDAAFSLLIPILHRLSRTDTKNARPLNALEERNVDSIDREINRLEGEIKKLQTLRSEITGPEQEP